MSYTCPKCESENTDSWKSGEGAAIACKNCGYRTHTDDEEVGSV